MRVEVTGAGVRIHADRDNFSARRKEFFVRHLATEGFIPDRYRWFSDECGGVEWLIEDCSVNTDSDDSAARRRASAFMVRLFVCASLLWLVQVTFLAFRQ